MDKLAQLQIEVSTVSTQLGLAEQRLDVRLDKLEDKLDKKNISPGYAALIATLLGLLGALGGAYLQGRSSVSVERLKFESSLIQGALEAESQEEAARNLAFLVDAKLIDGRDGAIERLAQHPSELPIRTLETRLNKLEAELSLSRCIAEGGSFDYLTLTCRGVPQAQNHALVPDGSPRR